MMFESIIVYAAVFCSWIETGWMPVNVDNLYEYVLWTEVYGNYYEFFDVYGWLIMLVVILVIIAIVCLIKGIKETKKELKLEKGEA